jgi:hypothetical protein
MNKRARVGTPQKGMSGKVSGLLEGWGTITAGQVAKLAGLSKGLQGSPKAADIAGVLRDTLGSFVSFLQDQGTMVSDLMAEVVLLESKLGEVEIKLEESEEKIAHLEKSRITKSQTDSRKEMTEKVKVSAKQFKIFDVDFKKEIGDRKELLGAAKSGILDRISDSRRAKYEELVRTATVQVLARTTTRRKQKDTDKDIWTAPILFTVDDRETRWELEDTLRSNGLFPTFHWDRDIMDSVKEMRTKINSEFPEDKFMVRIRPEERAGNWQIKADVKPREGKVRFKLGATWAIPPLDSAIRDQIEDWAKPKLAQKPSWAKVVASGSAGNTLDSAAAVISSATTMDME